MTPGRILVVDDDAAIRTVVREALRREGYVVETAGSVAEQRRALDAFAPDVLVTDVVLPDGNGLDIVPGLLEAYPGLVAASRLVMISGPSMAPRPASPRWARRLPPSARVTSPTCRRRRRCR